MKGKMRNKLLPVLMMLVLIGAASLAFPLAASADAGSPYVGEIEIFAGNFAPMGWAFCDGQQIPISENEALFNLIGTTYGGDGQNYFNLPDLRGRVPFHVGAQSGGGPTYTLGLPGGAESIPLTTNNMPAGFNQLQAYSGYGNTTTPGPGVFLAKPQTLDRKPLNTYAATANTALAPSAAGGSAQQVSTMPPYLGVNYIISLYGIYPSPT